MPKRNIIPIILLLVFVFGGCKGEEPFISDGPSTPPPALETRQPATAAPVPTPASTPDPVGERVAGMTTEELVGQLLVAGIQGTEPGEDGRQAVEDLHVGGIILFGRNVESAEQLTDLTNGLKELNREAGNIPLFLCVDEEGGMVSRMPPEVKDLPNAYDYVQAGGDPEKRGEVLAAQCAGFGFSVDFAPVLDVWSNPNNKVIGRRAFGTGAEEAAQAGTECAQAMMDAGIIPVVKHFPGHGDTDMDSHEGLPVVDKTSEELEELELILFRRVLEEGQDGSASVPAVMVAHILMNKIDPLLPASLSPAVVNGLLREKLGFEGVVFTDDLTMGAVADTYGMGEAAVKAVEAGCDMALVCHGLDNAKAAYHALLFAVEDGTLTRERLEESVSRILALKEAYEVEDIPVETPDLAELNRAIGDILP